MIWAASVISADRDSFDLRKMCRLHTGTKESTAYMGYASAAAMTKALRRWASIHMWTLQRVVEILAHKMGRGVDDHLANQCAVELVLAPAMPDPADPDNPGGTHDLSHPVGTPTPTIPESTR